MTSKLSFEEFMKMMIGNTKYLNATEELEEYNIVSEFNGLEKFLKMDLDPKNRLYKQARYNILKYIITCVKNDPECGDYYDDENEKILREAGEMLYKEGGMQSMHDELVWSFIPKRYRRNVDLAWNGIGEWLG
jgi:hypothetical protein